MRISLTLTLSTEHDKPEPPPQHDTDTGSQAEIAEDHMGFRPNPVDIETRRRRETIPNNTHPAA